MLANADVTEILYIVKENMNSKFSTFPNDAMISPLAHMHNQTLATFTLQIFMLGLEVSLCVCVCERERERLWCGG